VMKPMIMQTLCPVMESRMARTGTGPWSIAGCKMCILYRELWW
jgi:hypothetical protein